MLESSRRCLLIRLGYHFSLQSRQRIEMSEVVILNQFVSFRSALSLYWLILYGISSQWIYKFGRRFSISPCHVIGMQSKAAIACINLCCSWWICFGRRKQQVPFCHTTATQISIEFYSCEACFLVRMADHFMNARGPLPLLCRPQVPGAYSCVCLPLLQ